MEISTNTADQNLANTQSSAKIEGPTWDLSSEYAGFDSAEYKADFAEVEKIIQEITGALTSQKAAMEAMLRDGKPLIESIQVLQKVTRLDERAQILGYNLGSYASLESSIDSSNEQALRESVRTDELMSKAAAATMPLSVFITRASEEIYKLYLEDKEVAAGKFNWDVARKQEVWTLSEAEEVMLAEFRQHGPDAFGRLYSQISGEAKVQTETMGEMGLAKAGGLIFSGVEQERREAWQGIQKTWKIYQDSVAATLNNLAGWRLQEYKKRSAKKPMNFLSAPLVGSRIEAETLEAMMSAVEQRKELVARGLKAMAKRFGKSKLDPWDLLAPLPETGREPRKFPYAEGLKMVRDTFASLNPQMGEFIDIMDKNNWVDGRVLPTKRTGAFCSGFSKSRTPRVFQTYMGSLQDVSTLAHELGHAFHSWVMKDMPISQTNYPMTLAETASIFAETAMSDELLRKGDEQIKLSVAYADVADVVGLLGNIPTRFDFEKKFYEARQNGTLTPKELNALMAQSWRKWYGDALTEVEEQFWMTKLHFSIAGVSFYNFPYTFGYLFSLSVYSRREQWGAEFYPAYCNLLRDTGRMSAEDLVQKHFGEDIRKPEFWLKSIAICEEKIARFEKLV